MKQGFTYYTIELEKSTSSITRPCITRSDIARYWRVRCWKMAQNKAKEGKRKKEGKPPQKKQRLDACQFFRNWYPAK